jgi:hypothetical protein
MGKRILNYFGGFTPDLGGVGNFRVDSQGFGRIMLNL